MSAREKAWQRFAREVEGFDAMVRTLPVTVAQDPAVLRARLEKRWDFVTPVPLDQLTDDVIQLLRSGLVHVTHPQYYGLFNPSVRPASVMGDALAALYNPQLAAWSHAPVVQELERLVLCRLATALGYNPDTSSAFFTSGGAEANLAATLGALASRCPEASVHGIAAVRERPLLYVSAESHHSFVKIARMTGLGTGAIREVPVTSALMMDTSALDAMMAEDVRSGARPVMVVGTAGTTSSGVVDPLHAIAEIAARHGAWFHVDAAWGGGAVLSPRLRPFLEGIDLADSITWDAHKWLSVPMGAGMVFTRHPDAMSAAFAVNATYMPPDAGPLTTDPFVTTPQWSRRATGLKVFCALAELGMDGYAELIDHQAAMGDVLRQKLVAGGWLLLNETRLPVVNFTHPEIIAGRTSTTAIRDAVYAGGQAWISECHLSGIGPALRACITSYHTTTEDLDVLVQELERARR